MTDRSWGHKIHGPRCFKYSYTFENGEGVHEIKCGVRGCQGSVTHECEYSYVTGRQGRVTTARKGRCLEHARKFAKKHGIQMPEEA